MSLFWARTLGREESTLFRAEYTLERKKVPRFSASGFPPYFPDALPQVAAMKKAIHSARRSRARARMLVPRRRNPPAPAAQPFFATLSDTNHTGWLEVTTAALGMLDRVT